MIAKVPSYPLSKALLRAQPGSVQLSNQEGDAERVGPPLTGAIPDIPERVVITMTFEIEASPCAVYELERFLNRPGRRLWLRHWLGEAIRYVVEKDRGRAWTYLVRDGKVSRESGNARAC